jgi:acetyltransferase-like isoleucine patch superfamily enzyme
MSQPEEHIQKPGIVATLEKLSFLFGWLRWFYPRAKGIELAYLLYFFFPQKILRINGSVPWPVHFTSRVLFHKNIQVGHRSSPGSNAGCYIQGKNGIQIGHNCRFGPNIGLISANHDPQDYDRWLKADPIVIGSNVWLGMNTVVMPGVKIGDNVIVGSNSTVTKDLPSHCIAAGSPCKVIREKAPYTGKDYSNLG